MFDGILGEFLETLRDPVNPEKDRNYKKVYGVLRVDDCFCAEGILADILVKRHPLRWEWKRSGVPVITEMHGDYGDGAYWLVDKVQGSEYTMCVLPEVIYNGLWMPNRIVITEEIRKIISEYSDSYILGHHIFEIGALNDSGIPWEKIADIIEIAVKNHREKD